MKTQKQRQSIPPEQKYTIKDFNRDFPTDDACLEHVKEQRWPNGITYCEKCETERKHYRVSGRTAYACDHCGNHIYPLAGTIFEKSSTSLRLWFHAIFQMGSTRCGISAKQIQRETGVTYKTAWRMFKQIRTLMSDEIQLEGHQVEMDESYFGARNKRGTKRGRPSAESHKQCVVGIVERSTTERKGRVVCMTAENAQRSTLHKIAAERILPESTVFTDDWSGYHGLEDKGFTHKRINHSEKIYVMTDGVHSVHTQTIDGFWSLVKTGIRGVYHQVSKKYLQTYLDEYGFRYNRRDVMQPMFISILKRVSERAY